MNFYDGSPVWFDPTRSDKPPIDCKLVKSQDELQIGDKVFVEGYQQGTFTVFKITGITPTFCAETDGGNGAFLRVENGRVVASSYYNVKGLERINFT